MSGGGPMGGGGGRWMSTRRWARRGLSEQLMDLLLESKLVGFSTPLIAFFWAAEPCMARPIYGTPLPEILQYLPIFMRSAGQSAPWFKKHVHYTNGP